MKLKKYLKFTVLISILSFFAFGISTQKAFAEEENFEGIVGMTFDGYEYRIDLRKFYVINPNPVTKPENENDISLFKNNDSPYFTIKNPEENNPLNQIPKNLTVAESTVFSKINGVGAFPLSTIKLLAETYKTNTIKSMMPGNEFILFAIKLFETTPNLITDNKSLLIIDDYLDFKNVCNKIYKEWLSTSSGTINYATACPFYSGNGLASSLKPATIDNFKKVVGTHSNLQVKNYSVDYLIIDGTPDKNILNNNNSWNFASGACFEIKAKGVKNLCTNTLQASSTASKGCDNKNQNNVYFLAGITCEKLNTIMFYQASIGLDTESATYKQEVIAAAALKEKTLFKPQVSFGGITEGISLPDYMNLIYKYLMTFALVVTGFVIVIGGVKYMIGQNDGIPMIKNAFIGVILLSSTYVILKTVNPGTVNMNIIELGDISRKTVEGNTSFTSQTSTGTTSSANTDLSPNPAIEIGSGWYFPVIIADVDVKNFKYNATSKSAGGSFGYFRRTSKYALENSPDKPIVCHHAVDIYTKTPGQVVAITDGTVMASGNTFANCSGGQVGSIIIQHKDKNGNSFIARYGEVDIVDTTKLKPGATVTAGQPLGNATRCGMLHFELHAKANVSAPKWRMEINLWPTILNELKIPESTRTKFQLLNNTIDNADQLLTDSQLLGKNCLDSQAAVNALTNDKSENNGRYLLNPSSFLINLWDKTGNQSNQTTQ